MDIQIPAWIDGKLQPYGKLATHLEGHRHKAVSIFVMAGREVLIQRRALSKYHTPGLWANTCCTHPNWGEDPGVCAIRRLDDELGITGLSLYHRGQVEYRADVGDGLIEHEVVQVYLAEATKNVALDLNPDEVMETRWIDYYDLVAACARKPEQFTPWLRIYLSKHSALIFGEALVS